MKRLFLVAVMVLVSAIGMRAVSPITAGADSTVGDECSIPPEGGHLTASVATQKSINTYFQSVLSTQNDVVGKLRQCWPAAPPFSFSVPMIYTYTLSGTDFVFTSVQLEAFPYTMTQAQLNLSNAALACMIRFVKGTSFPATENETGPTFTLHWAWPLPLPSPTDANDQYNAMLLNNGGSGGGCDGKGAPASCHVCFGFSGVCASDCVGDLACIQICHLGSCTCQAYDDCASGGLFGVVGGDFTFIF